MYTGYLQLKDLVQSHLSTWGVTSDACEFELGDIEVLPGGMKKTSKGLHFGFVKYTSTAFIDSMLFSALPFLTVSVHNAFRLRENSEDLANITIRTVELNDGRVNVEIEIEFKEVVYLATSENGPIEIGGVHYDYIPNDLWVAEFFKVSRGEA